MTASGAAILRVFGDSATLADAREVVGALLAGNLDDRAPSLAHLHDRGDQSFLMRGCAATLRVLLFDFDPQRRPVWSTSVLAVARPDLVAMILRARTSWQAHVRRASEGVLLSSHFRERVTIVEGFWGVPASLFSLVTVQPAEGEEL